MSIMTSPWVFVGLKPELQKPARNGVQMLEVENILETVSRELDVSVLDIIGKGRIRTHIEARMISTCVIMKMHDYSLKSIGMIFGKDHSTIIYYRETFNALLMYNKEFQDKVEKIMKQVNAKESELISNIE